MGSDDIRYRDCLQRVGRLCFAYADRTCDACAKPICMEHMRISTCGRRWGPPDPAGAVLCPTCHALEEYAGRSYRDIPRREREEFLAGPGRHLASTWEGVGGPRGR